MQITITSRLLATAAGAVALVSASFVLPQAQLAGADPAVTVQVVAPPTAATGDEVSVTIRITNLADSLVTVKVAPITPPLGPGQVAAYEYLRSYMAATHVCPPSGCDVFVAAGNTAEVIARYGVGQAGTLDVGARATIDGVSGEVAATGSTQVVGAACTVRGTQGADTLRATDPAGDVVCGFGLGDTLIPGPGPDRFLDAAHDTLDLRSSTAAPGGAGWVVDLSTSPGTVAVVGHPGVDQVFGAPRVIGGAGDDRLIGSGGANSLDGGPGDDRLDGRGGDDYLVGGRGDDVLIGGAGIDQVSYYPHAHPVRVFLSTNAPQQTGGAGVDTISTTVENLSGTLYDDLLVGDEGRNTINSGRGDDRIVGRGGDDYLAGGDGNDAFDGGTGRDVCKPARRSPPTSWVACERWS